MRVIPLRKWSMAIAVTALTLGTALAHHSTAEFDYTKEVTIKGVVKEVQWTNPHSYIQVLVDGQAGEKIQWSVEIGSPTLNGAGVVAAGTYDTTDPATNAVYLVDADDGTILRTIAVTSPVFAQPVFAGTHLFVAATDGTLTAYS